MPGNSAHASSYLLFSLFRERDFPVWDEQFSHNINKSYSHDHTVVLAARIWGLYGK